LQASLFRNYPNRKQKEIVFRRHRTGLDTANGDAGCTDLIAP